MKPPVLRSACLDALKHIACAVAVMLPFGAGAVMAASEALQPPNGRAVVVRCGAAKAQSASTSIHDFQRDPSS
ncbi:hypothetical protein J2W24_006375 [Variovorax boronicumulans]|uniref:hypothetical protein n=1 Tax=Variovorax boronicumulans TaxID=436515 RepID=UPI0027857813|nr:hypothetical protein [Variovorax boronicumulans]MDP9920693.1 hypothetical protein [Variovorax boronicumulans]